jgi:hypothetical protein
VVVVDGIAAVVGGAAVDVVVVVLRIGAVDVGGAVSGAHAAAHRAVTATSAHHRFLMDGESSKPQRYHDAPLGRRSSARMSVQ